MTLLASKSPMALLQALLCLSLITVTAGPVPAQPADWPNTVTGALVDERGLPVADVEVVLRSYPSDYEVGRHLLGAANALPEAVDRTVSGSDGSYSLSAPRAGPYRIEIWPPAPEDQPAETSPLVHGALTPLKGFQVAEPIEVPDRHHVAVRVLDADDQPVEGALVIADPDPWRSPGYTGALRQRRNEARDGRRSRLLAQQIYPTFHRQVSRTGTDGIAHFLMPTAEANVAVHAKGFSLGEARTQSGRAVFHLERSAGIRLRVRGPEGRPEPEVLVRAASQPGSRRAPLTVTDETGETVVGPVGGSEPIWALERADHAFAEVPVPASPAADTGENEVDVRLEAPLRIPGRVVDTTSGLSIQGAAVWVRGSPGVGDSSGPTGTFDLSGQPSRQRMHLVVAATHYRSATTEVAVSGAGRLEEVRIGLEPSVPIHGLVTDSSAAPVAGAKIWATPRGGDLIPGYPIDPSPTTSAADGTFRVEETAYGYTYRLTAHAPGYAYTLVDLPPFESGRAIEPVQLVLQRGRRVVGTVVDDQGGVVAAAHVALLWPLDESEFRSSFDAPATATTTDGNGAFAFPATAPGRYEMRITHSEYAESPPSDIEVTAGGSDLDLGEFSLAAGQRIHGIVTGTDGQPVAGAAIRARARYQTGNSAERESTTDADGRFRLVGLSSDFADLAVRAAGYPLLVRPGVRANSEAPVRIELVPGASLHGRIIDNGGNAVAGGRVRLRIERDYRAGGDPRLWEPE
ncbi:MAG: carboxypeptidase regulatory-like domain-containing protein, partial [Acidobacteria bacterium]|nr:carboxypeptidase regulatory-like domain-containing protein [Acidobacteriota bacterium]